MTSSQPLTVATVNTMIKRWTDWVGLEGRYGAHTLRKTFGYVLRVHYGMDWLIISRMLNHSDPSITVRYLGLDWHEINGVMKGIAI